jgi:glycosyltransferase involved in cell wall biosynthesis
VKHWYDNTFTALADQFRSAATSGKISPEEVERDVQAIVSGRYRHEHGIASLGGIAVIWGAGSGFIPFFLEAAGRYTEIWCIEPNKEKHKAVARLLANLGASRVKLIGSEEELQRDLSSFQADIAFVLFLPGAYSHDRLDLFSTCRIKFLSGEFHTSRHNPMRVYRRSASRADRFFWVALPWGHPISGIFHEGPEVSVVVPAYNAADYLGGCVESLVNQTIDSKEIIVVNDGSSDETGALADQLAQEFECISVIHKPNGGCASARSAGWKAARGLYVGFVDADDWCDRGMFEALFSAAALYNADIAHCGFRKIDMQTGEVEEMAPVPALAEETIFGGVAVDPASFAASWPAIWCRLYRKSFLERRGIDFPTHVRRFDDLPFQFETFVKASRAAFLKGTFYNYRVGRPAQDVAIRDKRQYVHFELFRLLHAVAQSVGNIQVERQLKIAQMNSHIWVSRIIEHSLRMEYVLGATKDIFERRDILSVPQILYLFFRRSKLLLGLRWYLMWLFWGRHKAFPSE